MPAERDICSCIKCHRNALCSWGKCHRFKSILLVMQHLRQEQFCIFSSIHCRRSFISLSCPSIALAVYVTQMISGQGEPHTLGGLIPFIMMSIFKGSLIIETVSSCI